MKRSRAEAYWVCALLAVFPLACGGNAMSDGLTSTSTTTAGAGGANAMSDGPMSTTAGAGGGSTAANGDLSCPTSYPQIDSACQAPGLRCDYGPQWQCGYRAATCLNGAWRNATPADLCRQPYYGPEGAGAAPGGMGGAPPTGDAGAGGVVSTPATPACPADVPSNGSVCPAPTQDAYECIYNPGNPCDTIFASCNNGVWSLGGYAIECVEPGAEGGSGGESATGASGAAGSAR